MNRTLYQLAYRNVKKYKKHYVFVTIFSVFLAIFFLSYSIVWDNHYAVEKKYNQETYGEWYGMLYTNASEAIFEKYITQFDFPIQYGYCYRQGMYDNTYPIVHMTDDSFRLTKITLFKGRQPKTNHEIMISSDLQSERQLKLNQELELSVNNLQMQKYKIVGIVNKSQDFFPDIYTNMTNGETLQVITDTDLYAGMVNSEATTIEDDKYQFDFYDVVLNQYGYSQGVNENITMNQQQVLILIEIISLSGFALIALTSTSLKRRAKEFALLRGIGMTTRQLFLMIIYEMIYSSFIGVFLGCIASLGVSYGIMLYFEKQYGYFICEFSVLKILGYMLLLIASVMISCVYPIFSSTKQSLSGTFDNTNFQYIQVRYRKLKKQTKRYLALRELKAYKKITICLCVILSIITIYYTCTIDPTKVSTIQEGFSSFHYLECPIESQKDYQQIKEQCSNVVFFQRFFGEIPIQWKANQGFIYGEVGLLNDLSILNHCQIKGRIPQNSNEVFIHAQQQELFIEEIGDQSYSAMGILNVGDTFVLDGKQYKVVGCIEPNETIQRQYQDYFLYYMPIATIYVMPDTYQKLKKKYMMDDYEYNDVRCFYNNHKEKEMFLSAIKHIDEGIEAYSSDEDIKASISSFMTFDIQLLYIPMICSLLFCYFLNKNQMLNNANDYALYQLIGMTKKDIIQKQIFKALWITLFIFGIQVFWIIALDIYFHVIMYPIKEMVLTIVCVFIASFIIYCLPVYSLMKKDAISLLSHNE